MLLCGPLWVLCGPLRYLVIPVFFRPQSSYALPWPRGGCLGLASPHSQRSLPRLGLCVEKMPWLHHCSLNAPLRTIGNSWSPWIIALLLTSASSLSSTSMLLARHWRSVCESSTHEVKKSVHDIILHKLKAKPNKTSTATSRNIEINFRCIKVDYEEQTPVMGK